MRERLDGLERQASAATPKSEASADHRWSVADPLGSNVLIHQVNDYIAFEETYEGGVRSAIGEGKLRGEEAAVRYVILV